MQAIGFFARSNHFLSINNNGSKLLINKLNSSSTRSKSSKSPSASSENDDEKVDIKSHYYPNTSVGIKERTIRADVKQVDPLQTPYPPFPDGKNPKTGESGGPTGPEPTRFGDWERKGRVTDF